MSYKNRSVIIYECEYMISYRAVISYPMSFHQYSYQPFHILHPVALLLNVLETSFLALDSCEYQSWSKGRNDGKHERNSLQSELSVGANGPTYLTTIDKLELSHRSSVRVVYVRINF